MPAPAAAPAAQRTWASLFSRTLFGTGAAAAPPEPPQGQPRLQASGREGRRSHASGTGPLAGPSVLRSTVLQPLREHGPVNGPALPATTCPTGLTLVHVACPAVLPRSGTRGVTPNAPPPSTLTSTPQVSASAPRSILAAAAAPAPLPATASVPAPGADAAPPRGGAAAPERSRPSAARGPKGSTSSLAAVGEDAVAAGAALTGAVASSADESAGEWTEARSRRRERSMSRGPSRSNSAAPRQPKRQNSGLSVVSNGGEALASEATRGRSGQPAASGNGNAAGGGGRGNAGGNAGGGGGGGWWRSRTAQRS